MQVKLRLVSGTVERREKDRGLREAPHLCKTPPRVLQEDVNAADPHCSGDLSLCWPKGRKKTS